LSKETWTIHPAADLFPMLAANELTELAADIAEHGLREPIWLWRDQDGAEYLLDGRNRVAACQIAGVEVEHQWYDGDDPTAFVVSENVQRRHLTAGQRAALAYEMLPLLELEAEQRRRRAISAARCGETVADLPPSQPKSRDLAAASTKASGRVVGQYKRIVDQAPDLAAKVKSGAMPIDRADRIIRDREAEDKRIAKARAEAAASGLELTVDIRHGDFRDVLVDLRDVDAIITDPPYPREYLPLLADLAAWADKVLAPDGVLAVLMGQSHLLEAGRLLEGGRPYRWTACYLSVGGPGYVSHSRRVHSTWKPLLVYGGGPRFSDVIRSEGINADAKNNHKWGQDYGAFHTIVERLTEPGQTVADPFMGSGTTLLAAHALGRHAIGCDVDAESVIRARERLS
jgi:hypothetical protein